ncbi:DUF3040 domain-containing protein [Streptomyces sp. NPDC016309]|uniref:DUF3040 domain-containing protein n=1 Tax=Streptomyces sp. NPDC016309 TaxID=3364965 RepID=UPI0036F5EDF6
MEHESEGRILAQIERGLTSDDPGLAARMSALNGHFPGEGQDAVPPGRGQRSWRRRTAWVLVVIALVGLLLTAILNASSAGTPEPPSGQTPAVSL